MLGLDGVHAVVARNQVPMLFTFDEDKVDEICHVMAEGLEYMYNYISYFPPVGLLEEEEEW